MSQDGGSGLPLRGSRAMLSARLQVDPTVTATPRRPWNPSRLAVGVQLSHHIEESLSLPNFDQRRLPGVRTEQPRSFGGPTPPWLQRRGGLEACFERRRICRHVVRRLGGPRRSRVGLFDVSEVSMLYGSRCVVRFVRCARAMRDVFYDSVNVTRCV